MITYAVTVWQPGVELIVIYDSSDNRTAALRAAGDAVHAALNQLPAAAHTYLAVVVDTELLVMLTVGCNHTGHPDLTAALTEIDARLVP